MKKLAVFSSTHAPYNLFSWPLPALAAVLLVVSSQINYVLFHTLAELACIAVGTMMALTAWHTRNFVRNSVIFYLGCAYFWIGILDLTHTFAFEGMTLLPGSDSNLSTQLWLAARFTEATALLTITLVINRNISFEKIFLLFGASSLLLLLLIGNDLFPTTYIDQQGLTNFKIGSEYIIIAMLACAALLLRQNGQQLSSDIYRYFPAAIALTIIAELCFTRYQEVDSITNMAGHILKFFSFWLIFLATVRHTLERPFALMARDASTYDAIPDATIIVDRDNIIQQANRATCRLLGAERTDIIGKHAHDLFHGMDNDPEHCDICITAQRGQQALHQQTEHRKNTWYKISTYPISNGHINSSMVQVIHDMSEKIASKAQIKRLTTLIEQAPDLIAICTPEGTLEYLNPAGHQLLQLNQEQIPENTDLFQLFNHFASNLEIEEVIQRCKLFGNWTDECELIISEGQPLTVSLTIISHHDSQHQLDYFSLIARNISMQKQQQEIIRHVQKMDALGQLTSGIAHDFNNILSVIIGYSQILRKKLIEQEKLHEYADEIYQASARASRLTQQLLAFSRKKDGRQKLENINIIIRKMQQMLQQTLSRNIEVTTYLTPDLWASHLNRDELEDTLLNLAINAMHAMPEGGKLAITTANRVIDSPLPLQLGIEAGSYATVSISDTGCGIPEEILPKIFEPFFTTKKLHGTGLGLSQAFGFMKRSNGGIQVQSKPGEGSTFTLYFPRSQTFPPFQVRENNLDINYIARGSEKILVVDDEPAICRLTKNILSSEGYRVMIATSTSQAKMLLKTETINLLLCDLVMPGESGIKLAHYAKQTQSNTAIILLAGHHYYDSELNHLPIPNGTDILNKPFTPNKLLKMVREQLDKQQIRQQQPEPV